jgi:hypothetical protein
VERLVPDVGAAGGDVAAAEARMRALFLGGSQNGVMLNLHAPAPYWDFPIPPPARLADLSADLPDEVAKFDVHRYKLSMISPDRESAIYTECGDAIDALTRSRDWISDADPIQNAMFRRRPQPVYAQPRRNGDNR